jgi:hypothetical protein
MAGRDSRGRAWLSLLLLVLAACSSGGGERSPGPKGDHASGSSESPTEATGTSSPSPVEGQPDLTTTRFETPSGNIICESFSSLSMLTCAIASGLVPEPSNDLCPSWIGVFIQVGDYAGPACSGDEGISRDPADVLGYGKTWALTGVTCLSESTGLTCRDESGNGFTLARAGWSLLGKEAAATAMFPTLRKMVRTQARSDLPGQVASVSAPVLRGGDDCGELQEAFVEMELADGRPVVYTACYVSGTWDITEGPLYPD